MSSARVSAEMYHATHFVGQGDGLSGGICCMYVSGAIRHLSVNDRKYLGDRLRFRSTSIWLRWYDHALTSHS